MMADLFPFRNRSTLSIFHRTLNQTGTIKYEKLSRRYRLAAELYAYSYANYSDHLGNERFTRYMPNDIDLLERALAEK